MDPKTRFEHMTYHYMVVQKKIGHTLLLQVMHIWGATVANGNTITTVQFPQCRLSPRLTPILLSTHRHRDSDDHSQPRRLGHPRKPHDSR